MQLHLVPLAPMTATVRETPVWPVDVYVKTDQGNVCLKVESAERDELDRLLAQNDWPAEWSVGTDRGRAHVVLTRHGAVSVRGLVKVES